jgi:hypothetical protein
VNGVLIGDEQGLGKTVQAIAVLEATTAYPAIIVVPTSVRLNWRRELQRWLPHRTVTVCYGTKPEPITTEIAVIGWDTLYAWAEHLTPKAVVFDESHLAKSGEARRTHSAIILGDRARDNGGYVLALSGTPVLNKAQELMTQLRIIGRLDEFGGARGFKRDFSAPETRPILNRQLRARCYVRRRKDEVLTELPPKRYAKIVVEGDPVIMERYRKAEEDIVDYIAKIVEEGAKASGLTDAQARRVAGLKALRTQSAQHLVAITTLKQIAVEAKQHAIGAWLTDFVASGKKVVVFGYHRRIVDWIADEFAGGIKIQGSMDDEAKQANIDRFQNVPEQQVISCSLKAAGVGITLTSASDVLFVEQGWTPADQDQASDRCHRIGQTDSVTVYTTICEGTIDEAIYDLIEQKRLVVNAVTDGTVADVDSAESVLSELLVHLAGKRA